MVHTEVRACYSYSRQITITGFHPHKSGATSPLLGLAPRPRNHKNKWYKKWLRSHDPDDELKYKNYFRVFKRVVRAAQSAFYKD